MVLKQSERTETYLSVASLTAAAAIFAGGLLFESRAYHRIFLSSSAIALSTTGLILSKTKGDEARRYSQLAINSQWEKALILSEHGLEDLYKRLHPRAAREWQEAEIVEEQPALPEATNPPLPIDSLLNYPSLALIGPQGSGKSRLAAEIMLRKGKSGHRLIILDPHAAHEDWQGLEVIGAGLDYDAIASFITQFCQQVKEEYKLRNKDPNFIPEPITILCEEMTGWAANVKNAGELMRVALSDTRKLKKNILIVSHGDTLATLGAPKGMGKAKDAAMAKVILEVDIDPVTREACPKFEGTLQLPGRQPELVSIEKLPPLPPGIFSMLNQTPIASGEISDRNQPQQSQQPKPTDKINLDKTGELEGKILTAAKRSPIFQVQILELEADKIKIFEAFKSLAAKGFGYIIPNPKLELTEFSLPEKYKAEFFGVALEKVYTADDDLPASVFSAAEWELLGLAGETGSITVRDAQNSNLARREEWDSDKIKSLFSRFAELGLGSIHHGARGVVEFRVNGGQGND